VLAGIERHDINAMTTAPGLLRGLLALAPQAGLLLPQFRRMVSVGALLFPDEIRRICASVTPNLVNFYGSSGAGCTSAIRNGELARKPGSVGRPMYGVEVEIVDDGDRVLPAGETGWLRTRGPGSALAIEPPDPADRTIRDGWHYPGDYAFIDDEGFVFLQGRDSDLINVGGMIVFAPEVERAIAGCPGVREVAVAGQATPDGSETVLAAIVAQAGTGEDAIVAQCRRELAAYKRPKRLLFVDALPRNSNGKILRNEVLAWFDRSP
jgi:acyl-coenzyme A synthetase/AMP-(fatty) acid ligase